MMSVRCVRLPVLKFVLSLFCCPKAMTLCSPKLVIILPVGKMIVMFIVTVTIPMTSRLLIRRVVRVYLIRVVRLLRVSPSVLTLTAVVVSLIAMRPLSVRRYW